MNTDKPTPQQRLNEALQRLGLVATLTHDDTHWHISVAHLDAPVSLNKLFVECATVTLIASVLRDKLDAADKRWRQAHVEGQVPEEYIYGETR